MENCITHAGLMIKQGVRPKIVQKRFGQLSLTGRLSIQSRCGRSIWLRCATFATSIVGELDGSQTVE
ncbi:hypothetical protein ACFLTP_06060 [Chloroflexota bacterium]